MSFKSESQSDSFETHTSDSYDPAGDEAQRECAGEQHPLPNTTPHQPASSEYHADESNTREPVADDGPERYPLIDDIGFSQAFALLTDTSPDTAPAAQDNPSNDYVFPELDRHASPDALEWAVQAMPVEICPCGEGDQMVQHRPTAFACSDLLASFLQIAADLAAIPTFDDLLQQTVMRTVNALPLMQAGTLWLYDPRDGKLWMQAAYELPLSPTTIDIMSRCPLSPGEGLVGQLFAWREPVIIDDPETYQSIVTSLRPLPPYEQVQQEWQEQLPHPVPVICLPLHADDEAIGVMILMHLGTHAPEQDSAAETALSPGDIQALMCILPTFSRLIATTIRNKQRYDKSQLHCRRLDAFDAVVTAISTATDLHDLLRSVLDVMMGLLPPSVVSGAIFLLHPTQARLTLGAHHRLPAEYADLMQSFTVSGSACEEVVRYGQPTLRPLIEERGEMPLLGGGLESCAYLPLLAGGTVVGALGLYGDAMLYKQLDMTSLMPLGNQVGFAIANVRLYEDSYLERRKLNTVVNSIAEGVVMCDSQGRLVLANEAAMELLSLEAVPIEQPLSEMPDFYSIRDLEGQPLPVEQLPMARALSGETFHDYRVLLHGVSGNNSVMSFSGAPARADNDTIEGAVVIFRDITANQKLERAKDEFLAVAAHELRSPLAAVRSYAEMLLRRERQRHEEESRDVRGLSILSQQVSHMLRMVDNLLDVSRLDAGQLDLQLQRVNLVSLATQVIDQHRPVANGHEFALDVDQPELLVECDTMRVRQVLTNLVSNAIKYSPPNTSITVQIAVRTGTAHPVQPVSPDVGEEWGEDRGIETWIPEYEQNQSVHLTDADHPQRYEAIVCVADQGNGLTSEQQVRLFERFYRVKSRRAEGLGLGLYLSRQFVLMHGGRIWVESAEGKGSTFCFTLPMREE